MSCEFFRMCGIGRELHRRSRASTNSLARHLQGCLFVLVIYTASTAFATGFIAGDSGGNEKVISIFDRTGCVWHCVTGPSKSFRSPSLHTGEYLVICDQVVAPVVVRDDRVSEVLITQQWAMDPDCETWSSARKKFGQTFVARGPWINSFSFWNPGEPLRLVAELRESGPDGDLVGKFNFDDELVRWIRIVDLEPGCWRTVAGDVYYLSIASPEGKSFRLGTPARGDVYSDGRAYYDDVPKLDCDMGFSIQQDADNCKTIVRVSLHQGLGFKSEGPASGSCRWAAQSFVATTRNIRTAWLNAGWSVDEGLKQSFVVSIHENSPFGESIGPERTVLMIKDWGATAAWFEDEIPVEPGKKYAVRYRREDGKPFYAYLATDLYPSGEAFRAGLDTTEMDLTCVLRGEKKPGSVFLPHNITIREITPTTAAIEWDTAVPTTSRLELKSVSNEAKAISDGKFKKHHRMTAADLTPNSEYSYQVGGEAEQNPDSALWSRRCRLSTLPQPTAVYLCDKANEPVGRPVQLVNPSFEQGLDGWKKSSPMHRTPEESPPPGIGDAQPVFYLGRYEALDGKHVLGWKHCVGHDSGPVPRKLDPPVTQTVFQTVETTCGSEYILSAWICTDQRQGGWNRNDRVRLLVDPTGSGRLHSAATVDEEYATQWYSTGGMWRRYRLKFRAQSCSADVGVQLYQWWVLAENHIYIDSMELHELQCEQ